LGVWEKIAKLNSANIKTPQFRPAGETLEYTQLCTVPLLQDSCIHSTEHNVDDSSLSQKEFRVTNEVHSWGSRPRTI